MAEDEPQLLRLIASRLAKAGFEVLTAADVLRRLLDASEGTATASSARA